jgi:hypothetical protein
MTKKKQSTEAAVREIRRRVNHPELPSGGTSARRWVHRGDLGEGW